QARLLGSLFAGGHNYKVWASVSQRFYWSFHQGLLPVYRLTALAVAIIPVSKLMLLQTSAQPQFCGWVWLVRQELQNHQF
ncbi:hypothetical protein, partial [Nostoc sp. ChiSLP03a]|uniref:hypothetical protein n=1 Tax=Nostoc sp. ChiSLP03a TaxID=3075380 RepID=UPI002AD58E63